MAVVPLTQGKVAVVDDADLPLVSKHKWYAERHRGRWYARTRGPSGNVRMHQVLAGPFADHVNGDGLDNRRSNLRTATTSQNLANRGKPTLKAATSRFKGVSRGGSRRTRPWRARIRVKSKTIELGSFVTEEDAAAAYDAAAREWFGEFARPNEEV